MPRGASALFQSTFGGQGNFELLVTDNQSSFSGSLSGGLLPYWRDNDRGMVWRPGPALTRYDSPGLPSVPVPVPVEFAYRFPCWVQGTDRLFHGVCVLGSELCYFARDVTGRMVFPLPFPGDTRPRVVPAGSMPLPRNCVGAPAFLQSFFGRNGNFEIVSPVSGGGMDHYWCNNDAGLPSRSAGAIFPPAWFRAGHFGRGSHVEGVRLIHSEFGNLEAVALEWASHRSMLVFYWQNGPGGPWSEGEVIPGSEEVGGLPGFIQSSFQSTPGQGNFEVVAPAVDGGLLHWFSFLDTSGRRVWHRAPDIDRRGIRVTRVHLIQSNYGGGNLEVVAETGGRPYGYGALRFYYFETGAWRWWGPFPITPVYR